MNKSAQIRKSNITKDLKYNNIVMVKVNILYPQIKLEHNSGVAQAINRFYQYTAFRQFTYAATTLYQDAIKDYRFSQQNEYPFNYYEVYSEYTTTLNEDCHLSLYTDKYQYTGGAHGTTLRTSESWNLVTGHKLALQDLFPKGVNYKNLIIEEIKKIAQHNMQENPNIYFENYKELIVENFQPNSFYLTPNEINIYYQQYDIAPYATGIVVFSIPYKKFNIKAPSCKGHLYY